MKGAFIVFEGVDRSGKTTQACRLVEYLNDTGRPSVLMKFPDRSTPIGGLINSYLRNEVEMCDETIHLLFAANRWEMRTVLLKHLEDGMTVVADRYSHSGVAFSVSKGMEVGWCTDSDRGLPSPDVVLYMNVSNTQTRNGWGNERYETAEFQDRVRETFALLREPSWRDIDASAGVDEVETRVREIVDALEN